MFHVQNIFFTKKIEVIYCLGEILLIDIDQKSSKRSTCSFDVFTSIHTFDTCEPTNFAFRWINT